MDILRKNYVRLNIDLLHMITSGLHYAQRRLYYLLFFAFVVIYYILTRLNSNTDSSVSISSATLSNDTPNICQWKFHKYSPSSWEFYWSNNITYLQNHVCPTLKRDDQVNKSVAALEYIIDLQRTIFTPIISSRKHPDLFSKMYYQFECSKSSKSKQIVSQYIEPLIGLLRDPATICFYSETELPYTLQLNEENGVSSKRFLLLGPSAPYDDFQTSAPIAPWLYQEGSQKILFDIGSSYFNGMTPQAKPSTTLGTRWFYEYFRTKSLRFDRIITFEGNQYSPVAYWNQVPNDLMGLLTFINAAVENKGKFNPWNILKSRAKIEDYVIIKLDIDSPGLESDLVQQILNDTSISSLIDEMFFEMHVTVSEMRRFWGTPAGELKDAYALFTKLRQLGIRMHSWP